MPRGTVLQSYPGEVTALSQPCRYGLAGLDDPQPVRLKDSPTLTTNTKGGNKRPNDRVRAFLGVAR